MITTVQDLPLFNSMLNESGRDL